MSRKIVTPLVDTAIFSGAPDEITFWIGKVARMGEIEHPELYDASLRFRGNVFVQELNFLDNRHLDSQGREADEYDPRSVSFIVAERIKNDEMKARIVGSIRLIMKKNLTDPTEAYPIEQYFSELFDTPIGPSSAEISRFIARYPEGRGVQQMISLSLIRAVTLYALAEKIRDSYCIIEEALMKLLRKIGISLTTIGEPKYIQEQKGTLYPVIFNSKIIFDSLKADNKSCPIFRTFFQKELENGGQGFYDASLIGGRKW